MEKLLKGVFSTVFCDYFFYKSTQMPQKNFFVDANADDFNIF